MAPSPAPIPNSATGISRTQSIAIFERSIRTSRSGAPSLVVAVAHRDPSRVNASSDHAFVPFGGASSALTLPVRGSNAHNESSSTPQISPASASTGNPPGAPGTDVLSSVFGSISDTPRPTQKTCSPRMTTPQSRNPMVPATVLVAVSIRETPPGPFAQTKPAPITGNPAFTLTSATTDPVAGSIRTRRSKSNEGVDT